MPSSIPSTPVTALAGRLHYMSIAPQKQRSPASSFDAELDQQALKLPQGLDVLPSEIQDRILRGIQKPQEQALMRLVDKKRLREIDRIFPDIKQSGAQKAADAMLSGEIMSGHDLALIEKLETYTVRDQNIIEGSLNVLVPILEQARSLKNLHLEIGESDFFLNDYEIITAFIHLLGESIERHPFLETLSFKTSIFNRHIGQIILPYVHRARCLRHIDFGSLFDTKTQRELQLLETNDYLGKSLVPKIWTKFSNHCFDASSPNPPEKIKFFKWLNLHEISRILQSLLVSDRITNLWIDTSHAQSHEMNFDLPFINLESINVGNFSFDSDSTDAVNRVSDIIRSAPRLKQILLAAGGPQPYASLFQALQQNRALLHHAYFRICNWHPEFMNLVGELCNTSPMLRALRMTASQESMNRHESKRDVANGVLSLVTSMPNLRSISLHFYDPPSTNFSLIQGIESWSNQQLLSLQMTTRPEDVLTTSQPDPRFFKLLSSLRNLQKLAVSFPILDICPKKEIWQNLNYFSTIKSQNLAPLKQFLAHHPKVTHLFLKGRNICIDSTPKSDQESLTACLSSIKVLGLSFFDEEEIVNFFSEVTLPDLVHLVADIPSPYLYRHFTQLSRQNYLNILFENALAKSPKLSHITIRQRYDSMFDFSAICIRAKNRALQRFPERNLRMDSDKNIGPEGAEFADSTAFPWSSY